MRLSQITILLFFLCTTAGAIPIHGNTVTYHRRSLVARKQPQQPSKKEKTTPQQELQRVTDETYNQAQTVQQAPHQEEEVQQQEEEVQQEEVQHQDTAGRRFDVAAAARAGREAHQAALAQGLDPIAAASAGWAASQEAARQEHGRAGFSGAS